MRTYARFNLGRQTILPYDLPLHDEVTVQLATGPLIDTEQLSVGGDSAVRGNLPDDGAYDVGFVSRNTLSYAPLDWNGMVTPFVLADFGLGSNLKAGTTQSLASIGGGASFNVSNAITASLTAAMALIDASVTRYRDVDITLRLSEQY